MKHKTDATLPAKILNNLPYDNMRLIIMARIAVFNHHMVPTPRICFMLSI